jgi:hypothetical protein
VMARNGLDTEEIDKEILSENYRLIRRAKKLTARINAEFDDGQPVHYRELMSRPFPEGMTFRLMGQEGPQTNEASSETGATAGSKT